MFNFFFKSETSNAYVYKVCDETKKIGHSASAKNRQKWRGKEYGKKGNSQD